MESTSQNKKQIRETILAKRESLKPEQVEKKSDAIQKNLSNMSAYRDAKIILGYIPIKNEVRTNKLLPNALPGFDENKTLVALKNNGELVNFDSRQVYKGMNIGSGKITNLILQLFQELLSMKEATGSDMEKVITINSLQKTRQQK